MFILKGLDESFSINQISNLKLAMERKEAELELLKGVNTRSTTEALKSRALSPFRMPRYVSNANLKTEFCQRPLDDTKSSEVFPRNCYLWNFERIKSQFGANADYIKMVILNLNFTLLRLHRHSTNHMTQSCSFLFHVVSGHN